MTVVVDVGCATYPAYPEDESVRRLIARFDPSILFGYDPAPELQPMRGLVDGHQVVLERKAVWTRTGFVGFERDWNPLAAVAGDHVAPLAPAVECVDLVRVVQDVRALGQPVILKLDCEGGEFVLVPYLHAAGVDALVDLLLVEWHGPPPNLPLRCQQEAW